MTNRWWVYQRERFPIFAHGLLIAAFSFSAVSFSMLLREAPGVLVVDKRETGGYVTPIEAAGEYATYVSRIREDATVEHGLAMWIVSDNLLKGAALNAVQIAETLIERKLIKPKVA